MNWFNFLEINKENNPLHKILFTEKDSIANIMQGMDKFFIKPTINVPGKIIKVRSA